MGYTRKFSVAIESVESNLLPGRSHRVHLMEFIGVTYRVDDVASNRDELHRQLISIFMKNAWFGQQDSPL